MTDEELNRLIAQLDDEERDVAAKAAMGLATAFMGQSSVIGTPKPGLWTAIGALERATRDRDKGIWLRERCMIALELIRERPDLGSRHRP